MVGIPSNKMLAGYESHNNACDVITWQVIVPGLLLTFTLCVNPTAKQTFTA